MLNTMSEIALSIIKKNWIEKYVKCGCCNGEGTIIGHDGKRYDCGNCEGEGTVRDGYDVEEELKEGTIKIVNFEYNSNRLNKLKIWYETPHDYKIMQEDIIERVVSEQEKLAYTD